MALRALMFPRARRSEPRGIPAGTFTPDLGLKPVQSRRAPMHSDVAPRPLVPERDAWVPDAVTGTWEALEAEVFRITLPPDAPAADVFENIEAALLAATDQLQRTPTQPELPPIADLHRRAKK